MRDFDSEIAEYQKKIDEIKEEKRKFYSDNLATIRGIISDLNSSDLLDLIESETTKRRVKRDKIRGGNDIEINKINMLLKGELWCVKIYLMFDGSEYMSFTQDKNVADKYVEKEGRTYREELVDLRSIY